MKKVFRVTVATITWLISICVSSAVMAVLWHGMSLIFGQKHIFIYEFMMVGLSEIFFFLLVVGGMIINEDKRAAAKDMFGLPGKYGYDLSLWDTIEIPIVLVAKASKYAVLVTIVAFILTTLCENISSIVKNCIF